MIVVHELSVVRSLWLFVFCLVFVACCLLFGGCGLFVCLLTCCLLCVWLLVVRCLVFVACCSLFGHRCLCFVVCYALLSVLCYSSFVVRCLLYGVIGLPFAVVVRFCCSLLVDPWVVVG